MAEKKSIPFGEAVSIYRQCSSTIEQKYFEKYPLFNDYMTAACSIMAKKNIGNGDNYLYQDIYTEDNFVTAAFEELHYVAKHMKDNGELSDKSNAFLTHYNDTISGIAKGDISVCKPSLRQIRHDFTRKNNQGLNHIINAFRVQAAFRTFEGKELNKGMKRELNL